MALINLRGIQVSFGGPPLLDGIDLSIDKGERICLLGRNGAGKSTLMKLILGELQADDGERVVNAGVRIARLIQEVPAGTQGSVFEVVADGAGDLAGTLKRYHQLSHQLAESADESLLERARPESMHESCERWRHALRSWTHACRRR